MYIRAHRNPPSDVYSLNGGSTYPISNLYMYLRMYDFVMFTCIGYKLPTFWEYMSIGEDSVRPSGAGLRNVHFLIMHTNIGYKLPTFGEYMSAGGFLFALRAQG